MHLLLALFISILLQWFNGLCFWIFMTNVFLFLLFPCWFANYFHNMQKYDRRYKLQPSVYFVIFHYLLFFIFYEDKWCLFVIHTTIFFNIAVHNLLDNCSLIDDHAFCRIQFDETIVDQRTPRNVLFFNQINFIHVKSIMKSLFRTTLLKFKLTIKPYESF